MADTLARKTLGNAAILLAGTALETVLQFLFILIVSRELGPAGFGFFGYVISLVTFAQVVAQFGLPATTVREITQRPAEEGPLFAATFRIRATLGLALFLVALAYAVAAPLEPVARWTIALAFGYLLFVPFDLSLLFDAHKLSRWDVPGKLAGRLASIGLLLFLWQGRGDLTAADAALCSTLVVAVSAAVGWLVARGRGLSLRPLAPTRETGRLARLSLPLLWSNLVQTLFTQSQILFVRWLSTAVETGFYSLVARLLLPILLFKAIVYRLILPILSEVALDRAAFTARLERILPALALIFMPATVLAIAGVEWLLVPLFGPEYSGAIRPFQIALSIQFLTGVSSMCGTAVLAAGDARTPAVGLTLGSIVSVLLSLVLIPAWGAIGAAWAAWGGELIANLYTVPAFLRAARPRVLGRLLKIAAASLAAAVIFYGLRLFLPQGAAFAASVLALALGLVLAGELTRDRLATLTSLVRRDSTRGPAA